MEDTLRGMVVCYDIINYKVLILVLMEDTLRDEKACLKAAKVAVLILVLMEDTLRDGETVVNNGSRECLNPCFNGRYS